jgi:hypothetical protein
VNQLLAPPVAQRPVQPGYELRPLPAFLRAPNAIVAKLGIAAPLLTPERLTRAASRRAGLAPNFPAHVGEALEVLCRSLHDESRLHWFGRANQSSLMITGLAELLLIEDRFRRDPSLAERELVAPLIVTGLPRSGTTFLHRLLSVPEAAEPVLLHQHVFPTPRRIPSSGRIESELLFHPWKLASRRQGLDAIHYVRPDLPDECNFGMRLGMRSMIFWATAPTYGYLEWLLQQDLREAYQLYRRTLLLHQARTPGKRLVLKCPHHLAWLPALTEALPEALIIQTHREPLEAVPSECKLILALQGLATRELDWRNTVAHNHLKIREFAGRSITFADTEAGRAVVHVDYRRLVSEPVAVAHEIHARLGLPLDDADQAAFERFHAQNPQHKHGKNNYSLAQFGLDAAQLEAEFTPYRERFLSDTIGA